MRRSIPLLLAAALATAACSTDADAGTGVAVDDDPVGDGTAAPDTTGADASDAGTEDDGSEVDGSADVGSATTTYVVEVWADNWMAVHVDGELVGEDSVPITTERSFNAETFTFEAALPFTVAIEAMDYRETDSGLEYIGEPNQQMGDGGIIAQVTDLATGEVVAVTDASWTSLVVHRAPLNTECEGDADPDATCEHLVVATPTDWTSPDFDDGDWTAATEWSAADVDPKDGYDEIDWDASAQLVWGTDLEVDNTVLLRTTVS